MTIEQAKEIQIVDYLQSLGYESKSIKNSNAWYCSPLRDENNPSFKVNLNKNLWYDFAVGEGGDIIKLIMVMEKISSVSEALAILQDNRLYAPSLSFRQYKNCSKEEKVAFENVSTKPLEHPALIHYLESRNIAIEVAKEYCEEIHYTINGKRYFAVSFANANGGYEIRSSIFKGCIPPKEYYYSMQFALHCHIFEGFMDFLSAKSIEYRGGVDVPYYDYIILNSLSQLSQHLLGFLMSFDKVHAFFDNDDSGRKATSILAERIGDKLVNRSVEYVGYKDLNDYLCNKPIEVKHDIPKRKGIKM